MCGACLVWQVANLTLMALGSSAPEILLSIIEIVSSGFYAGALGPSTIVGSAAFNLLGISAVCVVATVSSCASRVGISSADADARRTQCEHTRLGRLEPLTTRRAREQ